MDETPRDEAREASFQEEALPHLDAVYRFALRLTGAPDRAEDLVQDTFLRAYRAWHQFTPGTNCKSWLFTICRNTFLRGEERTQRYDEIVARETSGNPAAVDPVNPLWATVADQDPEGDFFGNLVDDTVREAIHRLPEEYRTAVVLSDVEGLNYAEIAATLGVPVGTVKSRLFRGRRQLQQDLYEYAVEMGFLRPKGQAGGGTEDT
jgi:RNA polymerase sigma-70 factor (ECF subfamily)